MARKNSPSNPTEDLVQELCSKSFLADFVYRSPEFTTLSGHRREAGDLLLPLKNVLVAIQVRAQELDQDFEPSNEIHLRRIQRRVDHAVNQVKTAKRSLESGALQELENLRGIRVPVHKTTYDQHVGVVVIDLKTPIGSSPEFDLCIANGLRAVRGIPVHVFFRWDFEIIISEVDTLPDFLHYLKTRGALIESGRLFPLTQELDLLAFVQTRYPDVERILAGEFDDVIIQSGYWDSYRTIHKQKVEQRNKRRRAGRIIDTFIETIHRTIGYADPDADGDLGFEPGTPDTYRMIAEEFASLHRAHRDEFGPRILEKARKADYDPKGFNYCAYTASDLGTVFLFLASREPRNAMRRKLVNLTSAIYVRMTGLGLAKRAVGIGTQNMSERRNAQDFCFLQEGLEFEDREELAALADEIFGPLKESRVDQWGRLDQP